MSKTREFRRFTASDLEVDASDTAVRFSGYASATASAYRVGGQHGWDEIIERGAFGKTLSESDDVRLLFDHDGIPMARSRSGTLSIEEDERGLMCSAELDLASPQVQSVASALRRGDLDEMSIGFIVHRQEWNEDYTTRSIRELQLFDVSVVTYPANPATVATLHDSQRAAVRLDEQRSVLSQTEAPPGISTSLARAQITASRRRA